MVMAHLARRLVGCLARINGLACICRRCWRFVICKTISCAASLLQLPVKEARQSVVSEFSCRVTSLVSYLRTKHSASGDH